MEDIKKLLEQNEDFLMMYSDESDLDNESSAACDLEKYTNKALSFDAFITKMTENNLTSIKRNGRERLPTRRPDPNVYNRNALLARENRKKKKIYLETIEKELQLARNANRVLLKALKHQMKIRRRLEKEKLYFKGLIEKRSDILGLNKSPKSPSISETETDKSFSVSSSFESLNLLNSEEGYEISCSSSILRGETGSIYIDSASDGTVNDLQQSSFDFSSFDFYDFPGYFTDLENEGSSCFQTTSLNWNDVCINNGNNFDNLIKQDSPIAQNNNILRDVNNDHSYVTILNGLKVPEENSQILESLNMGRMCSQHSREELLEIFCPTCSINPECQTPPLQLLNDKL